MRVSVSRVSPPKFVLFWRGEGSTRGARSGAARVGSGDASRCQSSIKAKEEKKGGQLLGSDGCYSSRLVRRRPQLNQVPAPLSPDVGRCEALNINLYCGGLGLYPVVDPDSQLAPAR